MSTSAERKQIISLFIPTMVYFIVAFIAICISSSAIATQTLRDTILQVFFGGNVSQMNETVERGINAIWLTLPTTMAVIPPTYAIVLSQSGDSTYGIGLFNLIEYSYGRGYLNQSLVLLYIASFNTIALSLMGRQTIFLIMGTYMQIWYLICIILTFEWFNEKARIDMLERSITGLLVNFKEYMVKRYGQYISCSIKKRQNVEYGLRNAEKELRFVYDCVISSIAEQTLELTEFDPTLMERYTKMLDELSIELSKYAQSYVLGPYVFRMVNSYMNKAAQADKVLEVMLNKIVYEIFSLLKDRDFVDAGHGDRYIHITQFYKLAMATGCLCGVMESGKDALILIAIEQAMEVLGSISIISGDKKWNQQLKCIYILILEVYRERLSLESQDILDYWVDDIDVSDFSTDSSWEDMEELSYLIYDACKGVYGESILDRMLGKLERLKR